MAVSDLPERVELTDPEPFLRVLKASADRVSLAKVRVLEMWGLVGLAALSRYGRTEPLGVLMPDTPAARFAHAVGFADVTAGKMASTSGDTDRTVRLVRFTGVDATEPLASSVSRLLVPNAEHEDTQRTLYYVINELLRNTLQHSKDKLGGVVGAQLGDKGRNKDRPVVQVTVADCGIGIHASLSSRHPSMEHPREAIDKALWPHISSAFDLGQTGSSQNAGMGLFFISEMAKLVGGRLLVASRGAALTLTSDENKDEPHADQRFLSHGVEYPGTLVSFEMPAFEHQNYEGIIETIRKRAAERTPRRETRSWIRFEEVAEGAQELIVRDLNLEDVAKAQAFAQDRLLPLITAKAPFVLDFGGIQLCTQSYVHALLFVPLRVAWALKVPIYVRNTAPAVRSTLELLQNYALAG